MFKPILSALNVAGGGKKFAQGGILGSETGGSSGIDYDKMAEAMSNLPSPVVSVDEISTVSSRVSVIENLSKSF